MASRQERPAEKPEATGAGRARLWRRLAWLDENGRIPKNAWQRAVQQARDNEKLWKSRRMISKAGISASSWVSRGPQNVGGRTRSLLINPSDPNKLLAGSVSGGLWRSLNGGKTWKPVDDYLKSLAIGSLAYDPRNPMIVYAGTGEGQFNSDAIGGAGIFKSVDGGSAWSQLPSTADWDTVNRIAVSPSDGNVILASKRYGGIMRSSDGGTSWTNAYGAQGSFDVEFDPTDGACAVAHIINYDFAGNYWFHAALHSSDGGISWEIAGGLGKQQGFDSRIELAYAPSDPRIVYALLGAVWRSSDGGKNYKKMTKGKSPVGPANGWYNNTLWVDPTNPNFLLAANTNLYRSSNAGKTFKKIDDGGYILTVQPHVDIHYAVEDPRFDGKGNRRVYVCTDGGIYRAEDIYSVTGKSGWERLDITYRTTQFYSGAGHGANGFIIGGTQDNGTLALAGSSKNAILPLGGDGGFVAVDPRDPNLAYGEYTGLNLLFRTRDAGRSIDYIYEKLPDAGVGNFVSPFILDPNKPDRMLAAGRSLWVSNDVRTGKPPNWKAIRPQGSATLCAVAVAPGKSNIIWVAQNDNKVYATANGTSANPTWKEIDDNGSANPFQRFVTRILFSREDPATIYVALGGFSDENLLRTTDGGKTWKDVTGNGSTGLPFAPIRGIAQHPQKAKWLYVGTEVGVFASEDGGETWASVHPRLAAVSVDEVVFLHKSTILLAATHGRGLWTVKTGS